MPRPSGCEGRTVAHCKTARMAPAHEQPREEDRSRQIEAELEAQLGALRTAVEDAVAAADTAAVGAARGNLVVALASLGSPEFDFEARFHFDRVEIVSGDSAPVAIAGSLLSGDVNGALDHVASVVASRAIDEAQLLKLTLSAVLRAGTACPELPWLKVLLGRICAAEERGATAVHLIRFLPQGGPTRADAAGVAAECVGALWEESLDLARGLIDMICRTLVEVDDQPLLATTADLLLQSLPPGHPTERNTLAFLMITSLNNSGEVAACVTAMHGLLDSLVMEAWDWGNFDLLVWIASVAGEAATTALGDSRAGLATDAVAVGDRAFGVVEQISRKDVGATDAELRDAEHRLSVAFSRAAAVARSLAQEATLEITKPDPAPAFRFRASDAVAATAPSSPGRSARISEARFLEECARVDWKAIPTPLEVDFGLDYRVEIPEAPGRISADVEFLVQLKSTSATPNKSGLLTVSIAPTTLKYWKSKVLPTLVVLFHHATDTFYTSWYFPALDDTTQQTFRFAREDEWDPITLQDDVQRYYRHVRAALASGGDWSVLSVMQSHCALLIKGLLMHPGIRRAALDPDAGDTGPNVDHLFLMLLSMHRRALCTPAPILSGQPDAADIVKLLRILDAIYRSWTVGGPQTSSDVRFEVVSTKMVFESAHDLLHVAVELDCALTSAIVAAQEARSAALSRPATQSE